MHLVFVFFLAIASFTFANPFSIADKNFRIGEEIKIDILTAIGEDGQKIRSIKPEIKQDGFFYMRRKLDGNDYGLFKEKINPTPFAKFYAFDLKAHKISSEEALKLRFYPKRRSKPYRDEPEIYFDGEFLYSPRLPVLYFVKNNEWDRLESTPAPGIVSIVSQHTDVYALKNEKNLGLLPLQVFPVRPGIYSVELKKEGYFSYVDAIEVLPNKIATLRARLMQKDIPEIPFNVTYTENDLNAMDSLEQAEVFYDTFHKDSLKITDTLSAKWFDAVYPKLKTFDDSALTTKEYEDAYKKSRNEALNEWISGRLKNITAFSKKIHEKIKSFEVPVKIPVSVTKIKIFRARADSIPEISKQDSLKTDSVKTDTLKNDSLKKDTLSNDSLNQTAKDTLKANSLPEEQPKRIDSIAIHFISEDKRIDAEFIGNVVLDSLQSPSIIDTLIQNLAAGQLSVFVSLEKNKPVWIWDADSVKARKHYRFKEISFEQNGVVFQLKGKFILPETLLKEKEVLEWLNPAPEKEETKVEKKDSVITEKKEEPKIPTELDSLRGDLVLLDSTSFRFRGKVIGISAFKIQTKEVSQEAYAKMLMKKKLNVKTKDKSKFLGGEKPVQNITWNEASAYCKALGGRLPTEAEWEYAARAGGNDGFIWNALGGNPEDYAVYDKNSGGLSKKDSLYGPQSVGSKKPNAFGIYDMAGNVSEWTNDNYSSLSFYLEDVNPTGAALGYTKIIKGGSFKSSKKELNATERTDEDPRFWTEELGFRCMFPAK